MSTPIEGALAVWYLLTGASLVFLVWDLLTNTPTGRVMKLAWVLVVIYTGPVGLFIYLLSCRQPLPGTHDAFIAPHWKQATGSLLHCVAGDATGIIISAAVVYHFSLPNGIDLIIEYVSAFVVGLFVFQALFMLAMYNGDYWLAVRKTFFAETVSMNMVMVGMIPTMVILMHAIPGAESPFHATFWAVMSLATMAGMATAYPINSWMVRRGLKHGMMSAMPKPKPGATEPMEAGMEMSHDMQSDHGSALPTTKMVAVLVGTFAVLALSLWITTLFAPITFTRLE
ncbi:MAG: DUF4396 domain-containing protein [Mariniblastus sp.]|nr:DUF4396 domain-containing protein [Mariniblastus sp.]